MEWCSKLEKKANPRLFTIYTITIQANAVLFASLWIDDGMAVCIRSLTIQCHRHIKVSDDAQGGPVGLRKMALAGYGAGG